MASPPVPHFLRASRKRLGFSQRDVAYLLGTKEGARVCRYERFIREPSLETILALELILGKPARELFAGYYRRMEREVRARAEELAVKGDSPPRRLQALKAIIDNRDKET